MLLQTLMPYAANAGIPGTFLQFWKNYTPNLIIDDFDSLVWAERYSPAGDFKAVFKQNIDERWNDLDENTLVCIDESDEVFIVEDRVLEEDADGNSVLTVTGRSFETIYEGRVARPLDPGTDINGTYNTSFWPLQTYGSDVSNDWALNRTSANSMKYIMDYWTTAYQSHIYNMTIKQYQVLTDVRALDVKSTIIKPGQVYDRMLELMAVDDLGVRNERPKPGGTENLVTKIYDGRDRTPVVVLSYDAGHFKSASYGRSIRDMKNWTWNFSYDDANISFTGGGSVAGSFYGKVAYVEMSDIKRDPKPNFERDWNVYLAMQARGDAYTLEHRYQSLFACVLSDEIPYVYGEDFILGDVVRAKGRFGDDQPMRVSEYVRVMDPEGERHYITLAALKNPETTTPQI